MRRFGGSGVRRLGAAWCPGTQARHATRRHLTATSPPPPPHRCPLLPHTPLPSQALEASMFADLKAVTEYFGEDFPFV